MAQEDTRAVDVPATKEIAAGIERRARTRSHVPALTLLAHPNVERVGEFTLLEPLHIKASVTLSRLEPTFAPPGSGGHSRPLADPYLSRKPFHLRPGQDGGVLIDPGDSPIEVSADGQHVRGPREFGLEALDEGVVLELGRRVVVLLHALSSPPPCSEERLGLVGDSEAIHRVRQDILRVADLDVSVLLSGETGTGKELVAQAIHDTSRRRGGAYVSVNMGAIPGTLATSELFGSVKGAFTGAVQSQAGYFLRARGGTLFLDEIGEAPAEVQVMLLRVLETGEIQRVGSQDPQKADVRMIAATDADLGRAIEEGRFKEPLLHRLSGYEIYLPPLRERRDDFGRLLFHFLSEELEEVGDSYRLSEPSGVHLQPWMPASIVARLARHPWPGNVRQLRNVARQLVIGSRGSETVRVGPQVERLLQEVTASESEKPAENPSSAPVSGSKAPEPTGFRKPSDVGEDEMIATLRANRWELKPTAEELGVSRASLYVLVEASEKVRKAADLERDEILAGLEACDGNLDAMVDRLEVSKRGLQMRMKQLGIS